MKNPIDIYKCKDNVRIQLTCHTTVKEFGADRYFRKGEIYDASIEPRWNRDKATLVWVYYKGSNYGRRFSVVNNMVIKGEPVWEHFTSYFFCPNYLERTRKIKKIVDGIV